MGNDKSSEMVSLLITAGVFLLISVWAAVKLIRQKPSAEQLKQLFFSKDEASSAVDFRKRKRVLILGALGAGALVLGLVQLQVMASVKTAKMTYQRPEYGEGDRHVRVKMILNGTERVVSLTIPEKEMQQKTADLKIRDTLALLQQTYGGKIVCEDLELPDAREEVTIRWRSLTDKIMDNSGHVLMEAGQDRRPIRMLVEAGIGESVISSVIEMELASLKELTDQAQGDRIVAGLKDGAYTDQEALTLPTVAENGDALTWETADHVSPWLYVALLVLLPVIVSLKLSSDYKLREQKKESVIQNEYPELIGELIILIGAGMSLSGAWGRLAKDYQERKRMTGKTDPLYEEVLRASISMDRGSSIKKALEEFSDRVRSKEIRRFSALLIQNARRGDGFLLERLSELSEEAWQERKRLVKERSEQADLKLLLPMMLLLCVVLVIVLTPALMSMQL